MKAWAFELSEMVHNSLWREDGLQHLFDDFCLHQEALFWHTDFFDKLLEARAMSLLVFHTLPPSRYHHSLSSSPALAKRAHEQAVREFDCLLQAEAAKASGAKMAVLDIMPWRLNPVARAVLLAYDQDERAHRAGTATAAGPALQKVLAQTLGDTKMVENSHQFGKDLIRSSRCKTFGNVRIMSNTLASKALEERGTPVVKVQQGEKTMAQSNDATGSVARALTVKGYKMPKSIQSMMLPVNVGSNYWPSPSPASLFQTVAATEWVFAFFQSTSFQNVAVEAAWVSVLAQAGHFVAHITSSDLWKVVATAEYGFVGWRASIETQEGKRFFGLQPDVECLQWCHIVDLQDWVDVPAQPALLDVDRGPIMWEQAGQCLPLDVALVSEGIPLTAKQMRSLLRECYNVKMPANASKKALEAQLVKAILPGHLQEHAQKKYDSNDAEKAADDD